MFSERILLKLLHKGVELLQFLRYVYLLRAMAHTLATTYAVVRLP